MLDSLCMAYSRKEGIQTKSWYEFVAWPQGYKTFFMSTQLSMKLQINAEKLKKTTLLAFKLLDVGILTFMSMINAMLS